MDSALPLSRLLRLPVYSEAPCLTAKSPLVKHYVCSAVIGCGRWRPFVGDWREGCRSPPAICHWLSRPLGQTKVPAARPLCRDRAVREVMTPRRWVRDPGTAPVPAHRPGHATRAAIAPPNPPLAPPWARKARLPHTHTCPARAGPAGTSAVSWSGSRAQGRAAPRPRRGGRCRHKALVALEVRSDEG